jgi:hypothetical protein
MRRSARPARRQSLVAGRAETRRIQTPLSNIPVRLCIAIDAFFTNTNESNDAAPAVILVRTTMSCSSTIYFALLALRLLLALFSPSYVHPDEFHQFSEPTVSR